MNKNNNKIIILITTFFLYAFNQFLIQLSASNNKCNIENKNDVQEKLNTINKNVTLKVFIILFQVISVFVVCYFIFALNRSNDIYIQQFLDKYTDYYLLLSFVCIIYFTYTLNLLMQPYLKNVGKSMVTFVLSIIFTLIFFVLLIYYFIRDLSKKGSSLLNVEFILVLLIIIIYMITQLNSSTNKQKKMLELYRKNQYNFLTINCFPGSESDKNFTIEESFDTSDPDSPALLQYKSIIQERGSSYIQLEDSIPIKFVNPKTNKYQDLILSDFYFPGSYYTYLSDSPVYGHPSIESIKLSLTDFQTRIIHLDLFSDKNGLPVVRCEKMANDAKALDLKNCLNMIKKYGWNDLQKYPIFLYLKIHGEQNEAFYTNVYVTYKNIFKNNLMDKKYSFSGRNGSFPISKAPINESKNKIILCTNNYPTRTILDELINAGNVDTSDTKNSVNLDINVNLYKETYVDFNGVGISQDKDKTKLLEDHRRGISFYYSEPNIEKVNSSENKSGLYNPNFQDIGQYGIQGTMMYLFVPDNNLNKWYMYFKSKNNLYPVLKDESLRALDPEKNQIKEQNPILGLQQPQKYCIIPGFMETEKSNLTVGDSNNSCSTN